jgi:glycosyltransferase involved in cell wall biosynthesis
VTQRHGTEHAVVPSKLYSALAHGRPVLGIVPGTSDVARIVRKHGCGLIADPDDPDEVVNLLEWAASNPEGLSELGVNARAASLSFERGALLERFVARVEATARNNGVREDLRGHRGAL